VQSESIIVRVGTSGYSFRDWTPGFYPLTLPESQWLRFYAHRFSTLELNTSYYGIPKPTTIRRLVDETPPGFRVMVKANQRTTHERADAAVASELREAIEPLVANGMLAGVLAQFPWSFRNTAANRDYLVEIAQRTPDVDWFVEFRHRGWIVPVVGDLLREHGVGYVSVDEPDLPGLVPPVAKATTPVAYIRLHGRNADAWWGGDASRYDYLYTREELAPWAEKIVGLAGSVREAYVFFNNCHDSKAPTNAALLRELIMALPGATVI